MKLARKSIDCELKDGRTVPVTVRELTLDEMEWIDGEEKPTVKQAVAKVATLPDGVSIGSLGMRTVRELWKTALDLTNGTPESEGN
ncbi:MAG: hypothetical protein ACOYOU_21810 [Kiritimatiellia bacterium]